MNRRRILGASVCVVALGIASASCGDSGNSSSSTTKLEEVGPQIAKLRLEVHQLRAEVNSLREEVATLTPSTDPNSGLSVDTTTTTTTTASESASTTTTTRLG